MARAHIVPLLSCSQARHEKEQPVDDLLALVKQIVPYHMTHNAGVFMLQLVL
jgi:hypothetical protein